MGNLIDAVSPEKLARAMPVGPDRIGALNSNSIEFSVTDADVGRTALEAISPGVRSDSSDLGSM
jgi:hypothetical protein